LGKCAYEPPELTRTAEKLAQDKKRCLVEQWRVGSWQKNQGEIVKKKNNWEKLSITLWGGGGEQREKGGGRKQKKTVIRKVRVSRGELSTQKKKVRRSLGGAREPKMAKQTLQFIKKRKKACRKGKGPSTNVNVKKSSTHNLKKGKKAHRKRKSGVKDLEPNSTGKTEHPEETSGSKP